MTTCTENCAPGVAGSTTRIQTGLVAAVRQWLEIQRLKSAVHKEREELLTFSDAALRDMGITRAQAEAEARRRDLPEARLQMLFDDRC